MRKLIFILMLCTLNCHAATLTIPESFNVLQVDDKKFSKGFFSKNAQLDLAKGDHVLVLVFEDLFENIDFADYAIIKSEKFVIEFTLDKEQALVLSSPKIEDIDSAKRYANSPQVTIEDANHKELTIIHHDFSSYEASNQKAALLAAIKASINKTNMKDIDDKNVEKSRKIQQSANQKQTSPEAVIIKSLPMLKYWWQQASTSEKELFKQYIYSQG